MGYTISTSGCKRCGLNGSVLSNGYCARCDYVLFGGCSG